MLLLALMSVAISPVAIHESGMAFLTVVAYLASLGLVQIFVKETINLGFPYPECITALPMICLCAVTGALQRPTPREATQVLPASFLNGCSMLAGNLALLHGSVAFVSMIGANVPCLTFALEFLRGRRLLTFLTIVAVLIVCCGGAFCIKGEKNASVEAFTIASLATAFRSMRAAWQDELPKASVSPLHLAFCTGSWTLVITFALMAHGEGLEGFRALLSEATPYAAKRALVFSIASTVCLNITQCYATKALGAFMSNITVNLNLVLVIALSSAWLHESIAIEQYVGVIMLATGNFLSERERGRVPP